MWFSPCHAYGSSPALLLFLTISKPQLASSTKIDRESIIRQFNLKLNGSHPYSPVQVGNGNFAFGADITGLQTFLPHNTLSSWAWHNSSLPTMPNQTTPTDFTGLDWWTHGRLVNYAQPNPAQRDISQWMISNPHRINLGRIGLWFGWRNVTSEEQLAGKSQVVDLYEGVIISSFSLEGVDVHVETVAAPDTDTVAFKITSDLLRDGKLGVFFDYPYASGKNKFDAPFVGLFNATSNHTTRLSSTADHAATIRHDLDATTYFTDIIWEGKANIHRASNSSHRYILSAEKGASSDTLALTATFTPSRTNNQRTPSFTSIKRRAAKWWSHYWNSGAFISLSFSTSASAHELQRRILLSQYLLAINSAGRDPAQESGLVNNGWYGKFHMEMIFWHLAHWTVWDKWDIYNRCVPGIYERFLPSSFERAKKQGYDGARIGKMSDPTGRSAPGEINSLLTWQQPHPMWFAEMEYRKSPTKATLEKWDAILEGVADFMASYAFFNGSTGLYDLGPPMYPVSENTNPNATVNPTFELAYWRFGLDVAMKWQKRQGKLVPEKWRLVRDRLAPLPVQDGVYLLYEGVKDMWTTPSLTEDHPALLAINGVLSPDSSQFDATIFAKTLEKVYTTWNFTYSYGWDFPLLAMTAARIGDRKKAVEWLLHDEFKFNEVGMPVGGARVPTPYFPASGGLLLAVGMMAGGWDVEDRSHVGVREDGWNARRGKGRGRTAPGFPEDWDAVVEGFQRYM